MISEEEQKKNNEFPKSPSKEKTPKELTLKYFEDIKSLEEIAHDIEDINEELM
jgi:hypothetical protein